MEKVVVKNLSRSYYDPGGNLFTSLDNVSLEWRRGESVAVMGESGSGKSTLARLLIGLEKPSAGAVFIDDQNTAAWSHRKWRQYRTALQAVFQDERGTLSPGRSVYQNAEETLCNLTDMKKAQRRECILALMEQLHLSRELLRVPVRQLSGGEQRRIGLLRALAIKPQFLILDEVTAGLDLLSTEAVLSLLHAYQRSHDCAYLLITHDINAASRLCSRMLEIDHGRIVHEYVQEQVCSLSNMRQ